jgi:hypothetical protein
LEGFPRNKYKELHEKEAEANFFSFYEFILKEDKGEGGI